MANTLNTSSLTSLQMVQSLHARGKLINTVNTSYSKDFTQKKYVPGTTVTIDIEHQPTVSSGRVVTLQDVVNRTVDVSITQYRAAESFTSIERNYNMSNKQDVRAYADKMAQRLVREMEVTGFEYMAYHTGNNVGSIGVDAGALRTYGEARGKIVDAIGPDRPCFAAVNPQGMTALTDSLKGATNPGKEISNQYLRGKMTKAQNLMFYESQSVKRVTAGTTTDFALAVTTTSVSGATTLVCDSAGTGTITAGTKITIAAVNAVDPETKTTLSYAKQLSVTALGTISGNAVTLSISPTLYGTDSPHQNVDALPQAAAVITIVNSGTASTIDSLNMVYDKDAFTLVSVPLPAAHGGNYHTFKNYNGIQIRIGIGAWDLGNDQQGISCDATWGWGKLREDHASCVHGN